MISVEFKSHHSEYGFVVTFWISESHGMKRCIFASQITWFISISSTKHSTVPLEHESDQLHCLAERRLIWSNVTYCFDRVCYFALLTTFICYTASDTSSSASHATRNLKHSKCSDSYSKRTVMSFTEVRVNRLRRGAIIALMRLNSLSDSEELGSIAITCLITCFRPHCELKKWCNCLDAVSRWKQNTVITTENAWVTLAI